MAKGIPKGPLSPPPGRPSWEGQSDLPLLYLGWGPRNFRQTPLPMHCDHAMSYYIILSGEFTVCTEGDQLSVRGPAILVFDADCAFGLTQSGSKKVSVLVWIWRGAAISPELQPARGEFLRVELSPESVESLSDLHVRCRSEVARADVFLAQTLVALRNLIEVEILRARQATPAMVECRWKLAQSWIMNNLSIHAPVPALCDYLRMSPNTLHRFFRHQVAMSPGAYFRMLKLQEARRLIHEEGWQVKATAYHLGYRHPNDLSRALAE